MPHDLLVERYWYGSGVIPDALHDACLQNKKPRRNLIKLCLETDVYYQPSCSVHVQVETLERLLTMKHMFMTGHPLIELYGNLVYHSYVYDMVRSCPHTILDEDVTMRNALLRILKYLEEDDTTRSIEAFREDTDAWLEPLYSAVVTTFEDIIHKSRNLLCSLYDDTYRRKRSTYMLDQFRQELIQVTWHPRRIRDWCLDTEELHDLFGDSSRQVR